MKKIILIFLLVSFAGANIYKKVDNTSYCKVLVKFSKEITRLAKKDVDTPYNLIKNLTSDKFKTVDECIEYFEKSYPSLISIKAKD